MKIALGLGGLDLVVFCEKIFYGSDRGQYQIG